MLYSIICGHKNVPLLVFAEAFALASSTPPPHPRPEPVEESATKASSGKRKSASCHHELMTIEEAEHGKLPEELKPSACKAKPGNKSWMWWSADRSCRVCFNIQKANYYVYSPKVEKPSFSWSTYAGDPFRAWDVAKGVLGL